CRRFGGECSCARVSPSRQTSAHRALGPRRLQMATNTYTVLYIGNLPDMDTDERNNTAENAHGVLGGQTFGASGDPLFANSLQLSLHDVRNDGAVQFDHQGGPDTVSYRLNGQDYSLKADSGVLVSNVQVTQSLDDGSTRTITASVRVLQDVSGN